jgi:hypothetical protein
MAGSIIDKHFALGTPAAKVVFAADTDFQWTAAMVEQIDGVLRSIGVVEPGPSSDAAGDAAGRALGTIKTVLARVQVKLAVNSLRQFAADKNWAWVPRTAETWLGFVSDLVRGISAARVYYDVPVGTELQRLILAEEAPEVLLSDDDGWLMPFSTEQERIARTSKLRAAQSAAADSTDRLLMRCLLRHGNDRSAELGVQVSRTKLSLRYALYLEAEIARIQGSTSVCTREGCHKPAEVVVKADAHSAGLCKGHHDEIVARVEAGAPWWKKGTLCFRRAVLREVQSWKQAESTCHFCGEQAKDWQFADWCCCTEHWPRVLKWVQRRSFGGFAKGLLTEDKPGLSAAVALALKDADIVQETNDDMDACLCCMGSKDLSFGFGEDAVSSLGERQAFCQDCRAACEWLIKRDHPSKLETSLQGSRHTEWLETRSVARRLRSQATTIEGWRPGMAWKEPGVAQKPPAMSTPRPAANRGLTNEDGTRMVVDSAGTLKQKLSPKEKLLAANYLKKKSTLLCDKLEVQRQRLTNQPWLAGEAQGMAAEQFERKWQEQYAMCMLATGQDAEPVQMPEKFFGKGMCMPSRDIERQRILELCAAEMLLTRFADYILNKETPSELKAGLLEKQARATIVRLRWGQTQTERLALGLTTEQAIKAGHKARDESRASWLMNDDVTKTQAQMQKADHLASMKAEQAVLAKKGKRDRPPRRTGDEAWGRGTSASALKRRKKRLRMQRAKGQVPTKPPAPKITPQAPGPDRHANKVCDLCDKKGHIKWKCPQRATLMDEKTGKKKA